MAIGELEAAARGYVNNAAVEQALLDYQTWALGLKENRKEVVHLLYFLKSLEERSGIQTLKNEKKISDIILSRVEPPNLERRRSEELGRFSVLRKEIGSKYQIEMEFGDLKGSRFRKNVSDLTI